jgi:hypothetical protein
MTSGTFQEYFGFRRKGGKMPVERHFDPPGRNMPHRVEWNDRGGL